MYIPVEDGKLFLQKEELDIAKDRVQTGEVNLRKEIIEEQQTVDIPEGDPNFVSDDLR